MSPPHILRNDERMSRRREESVTALLKKTTSDRNENSLEQVPENNFFQLCIAKPTVQKLHSSGMDYFNFYIIFYPRSIGNQTLVTLNGEAVEQVATHKYLV